MKISISTTHSLRSLLPHHYHSGPPGPIVLTLAAHEGKRLIGVLTLSRPTLNAPGRAPLPIARANPAARAQWLNLNLRTISRVIIDPRFRSQGIASDLIRHYLANPLTPFTEAFASMGHMSPLFETAGMTLIQTPPSPRNLKLAATLRALNIVPETLIDTTTAARLISINPALAPALASWANDSKATRPFRHQPLALCPRAAQLLLFPPRIYHSVARLTPLPKGEGPGVGLLSSTPPSSFTHTFRHQPLPSNATPRSALAPPRRPPHPLPELSK